MWVGIPLRKHAPALYRAEYIKIKNQFSLRNGVKQDEKNLSAEEKTRADGARLQKENVNKERKKGTCTPSCKGPQISFLLITEWEWYCEKQRLKGKQGFPQAL